MFLSPAQEANVMRNTALMILSAAIDLEKRKALKQSRRISESYPDEAPLKRQKMLDGRTSDYDSASSDLSESNSPR